MGPRSLLMPLAVAAALAVWASRFVMLPSAGDTAIVVAHRNAELNSSTNTAFEAVDALRSSVTATAALSSACCNWTNRMDVSSHPRGKAWFVTYGDAAYAEGVKILTREARAVKQRAEHISANYTITAVGRPTSNLTAGLLPDDVVIAKGAPVFHRVIGLGRSDLSPAFVASNRAVLALPRGGGYWIWLVKRALHYYEYWKPCCIALPLLGSHAHWNHTT